MDCHESQTVLGYSVFEKFEECYQYNENACFIADTKDSANQFLEDGYCNVDDCRIDAVTFGDVVLDFGASCGATPFLPISDPFNGALKRPTQS
jgi:hypothetical protein